jgi:hypothetical protein
MEHVTSSYEPVYKDRSERRFDREKEARHDGRILEQRQQSAVKKEATVERKYQHLNTNDQDHLHDTSSLVE